MLILAGLLTGTSMLGSVALEKVPSMMAI